MENTRDKLDRLRERIESSDEISDDDRELLLRFSDRLDLLKSEYSDMRHDKLLRHCTRMAENVGGLAQALEDREAAEDIVRWINRTYDNEYTNHDYRTALRVLGRRTTDGDDYPESVEWVPSGTSNSYDPVPNPGEMLTWNDDVLPMIESARNPRDAALVAVAFDSGARSGELQDLTVGDVNEHKYGLQIMVDGKTGQRSVTLISSVPYLQKWLADHPAPNDPDAPLWSKLSTPEGISYQQFRKCFDDPAERAGALNPLLRPTSESPTPPSWPGKESLRHTSKTGKVASVEAMRPHTTSPGSGDRQRTISPVCTASMLRKRSPNLSGQRCAPDVRSKRPLTGIPASGVIRPSTTPVLRRLRTISARSATPSFGSLRRTRK